MRLGWLWSRLGVALAPDARFCYPMPAAYLPAATILGSRRIRRAFNSVAGHRLRRFRPTVLAEKSGTSTSNLRAPTISPGTPTRNTRAPTFSPRVPTRKPHAPMISPRAPTRKPHAPTKLPGASAKIPRVPGKEPHARGFRVGVRANPVGARRGGDVPPILSSGPIWSPIPPD